MPKLRRPHRIAGGSVSLRKPQCDRGVNLTVNPGEMIGLVGHSGSGKSTLVNLMCRFYDVSAGAIPRRRGRSPLHGGGGLSGEYRTGAAGAVPVLRHDCREHRLWKTRCHPRRDRRRCGPRTPTNSFSDSPRATIHWSASADRALGGERQRISIARALLIDPRILILDEGHPRWIPRPRRKSRRRWTTLCEEGRR